MNAQKAFMTGQLKVKGNIMFAVGRCLSMSSSRWDYADGICSTDQVGRRVEGGWLYQNISSPYLKLIPIPYRLDRQEQAMS